MTKTKKKTIRYERSSCSSLILPALCPYLTGCSTMTVVTHSHLMNYTWIKMSRMFALSSMSHPCRHAQPLVALFDGVEQLTYWFRPVLTSESLISTNAKSNNARVVHTHSRIGVSCPTSSVVISAQSPLLHHDPSGNTTPASRALIAKMSLRPFLKTTLKKKKGTDGHLLLATWLQLNLFSVLFCLFFCLPCVRWRVLLNAGLKTGQSKSVQLRKKEKKIRGK